MLDQGILCPMEAQCLSSHGDLSQAYLDGSPFHALELYTCEEMMDVKARGLLRPV